MKFEIAKEVFDLLPNAYFGVVAVRGMENRKEIPDLEEMLQKNQASTWPASFLQKVFQDALSK